MDIESYIRADEIRALLADLPRRTRGNGTSKPEGEATVLMGKDGMLILAPDGAWKRITLSIRRTDGMGWTTKIIVYYRPDGERFIVSDLGEGLRAYRLRTGQCFLTFPSMRELFERTPEDPNVGFCSDSGLYALGDWPDGRSAHVSKDGLSDAICCVLLASLRVSHLTARGMG